MAPSKLDAADRNARDAQSGRCSGHFCRCDAADAAAVHFECSSFSAPLFLHFIHLIGASLPTIIPTPLFSSFFFFFLPSFLPFFFFFFFFFFFSLIVYPFKFYQKSQRMSNDGRERASHLTGASSKIPINLHPSPPSQKKKNKSRRIPSKGSSGWTDRRKNGSNTIDVARVICHLSSNVMITVV